MDRRSPTYKKKYREFLSRKTNYTVGIVFAVLGILLIWTGVAALVFILGIVLIVIAKNSAKHDTDWYFEKKRDRRKKK